MRKSVSYLILLSCVLLWCTLLVLPPLVASLEHPPAGLSHVLYKAFSPICHQYDSRSLHLFDHKLAVCSRCSAIYGGFLLGLLLYPLISRRWKVNSLIIWSLALGPMVLDVVADTIGVHDSTLVTRLITGIVFGSFSSIILIPLMIDGMTEIMNGLTTTRRTNHELEAR